MLVCDDEPSIIDIYKQYLIPAKGTGSAIDRLRKLTAVSRSPLSALPEGWTLLTATTGEAAVGIGERLARDGAEISVGFFDVKMGPGIDGVETVLRLTRLFPRLRFGIVSAYNDRPIDQINALLDADHQDNWDFLSKPFTEFEIRQKTKMLISMWLHAEAEAKARAELAYLNDNLAGMVTERTKELEQSRAKLELGERLVAMGTLAAGIGHEVNNPLTYVMSNLELATEELAGWGALVPPERLADVQQLLLECTDGVDRIRKIIKDLSVLTRHRGRDPGAPVELEPMLERALSITTNEIKHRARLVRTYRPVPRVSANESRLVQVIVNLLVNAAQSIPVGDCERNEIGVSTFTDARGFAIIDISDTGEGIPAEYLTRVFDPFFTLKPTTGTGLGLSISHSIVSEAGGSIELESAVGVGTRFRIALPPAVGPATEAASRVIATSASRRRGRVLAIDDEPTIGRSVNRALEKDHDVVVVQSGREGLAALAGGQDFDLILCDLMMPDMTGMDVHTELMNRRSAHAERMVFMTGGAFTSAAQAFLEQVPNRSLLKPFDLIALRELVDHLIHKIA